uniref:Ionotropic glutamate receptor C-terminal domain-containing protein n=1 Tax=Stomoxys calcitrans TaxID=35570 RepID=A0A1I8NQI0_STOCA
MPIAMGTQEILYCPCLQCYDERLDFLMKWTLAATMHPQLVVSQPSDYRVREHDVKRNLLSLMIVGSLKDPIISVHKNILKDRHFFLNMIVMYEPISNFSTIEAVLKYLYVEKFVNSDVYYANATTGQNEVFGFITYPEFEPENKTHLVGKVRQFYHRILEKTDLQGYRFETPLMMDAPKVVRYRDKNGALRIQGVTYNIMKMCLEYLNGTMVELQLNVSSDNAVDMQLVLEGVRQHHVELASHAYALFKADDDVQKSYPILVVNWCLMVPITNKVFTMFYPIVPFTGPVWWTILLAFLLVNLVSYVSLRVHNLNTKNFILINFCKFINAPPPIAGYTEDDTWFQMVLNGFIYIQGFLLAAFYTSMLGSFLAVTVIKADVNTIEDVIHDHLPVMIIDYELEFLKAQGIDLPSKFIDLLRPVNSSVFQKHQLHLNTSHAYFTTYDLWHFLNMQQEHLRPPLFRYTDICFGNYHLAFPMVAESPIWRDIEYLMLRIHSSGLYYYHEKKSFEYAHRAGMVKYGTGDDSFHTVGFMHLRMVVGFLLIGCLMGLMSFLHELWSYRKERNMMGNNAP